MAQTAAEAAAADAAGSGYGRFLLHRHDQKGRSRRTPAFRRTGAGQADIRAKILGDGYETAVAQAQQLTLDQLLTVWQS